MVANLNVSCLPSYSILLHETGAFNELWIPANRTLINSTEESGNDTSMAEDGSDDDLSEVDYGSLDEENNVLHSNASYNPWEYKSSVAIGMGKFRGELTTYRGGGYVAVLPRTAQETNDVLLVLDNYCN